jgi:hypothetical protein
MLTVSIPGLLMMGFGIALVFLILGYREKADISKSRRLIGIGLDLLGLMVIVTPLSWYGMWAITTGLVQMTVLDILILTVFSALGGLIIGVALPRQGEARP